MSSKYDNLITIAYSAFNNRDINTALSTMHEEVEWPKAFEGGYVSGQEGIRDYWTRQWKEIDPTVIPTKIIEKDNGQLEVIVEQTVKDREGKIIFEGIVKHIYTLQDGLLRKMEIGS